MSTDHHLLSKERLDLGDAVAAIIKHEDGRYLMQLRDQIPNIAFPGHWGLFGGNVDAGETVTNALYRELWEELEFKPRSTKYLTRFDFDLGALGLPTHFRSFYEVPIAGDEVVRCQLHEGARMKLFAMSEILTCARVAPYDMFALWLYANQERFD